MSWYALGNFTNHTGMVGFLHAANSYTGDYYGILTLVGLWFVFLIAFTQYTHTFKYSFTGASFICAVGAVFYRVLGLVAEVWVIAFAVMTALGVISLLNWGE